MRRTIVQTQYHTAALAQHLCQLVFVFDPTRKHRGATHGSIGLNDSPQARESGGDSPFGGRTPEIERALRGESVPRICVLYAHYFDGGPAYSLVNRRDGASHLFAQRSLGGTRHCPETLLAPLQPNPDKRFEDAPVSVTVFVH